MSAESPGQAGNPFRIGVDLGGTKIEFVALENDGSELHRHRVATPRGDYTATVNAVRDGVLQIEGLLKRSATVGVGIPGTISRKTHGVKNANSTWMNGKPFDRDLGTALHREVRCANDANCLAVSEATDGAGAGKEVVFAVILGTGCGGGIAFHGHVHNGYNGVAGEWGHTTLPWMRAEEYPGPLCYCGQRGCIETWISGTGLEADYERETNRKLRGPEIVVRSEAGEWEAQACLDRYENRLTRSLAQMINILDPDMIVLGGGVSQVPRLYRNVPSRLKEYVFGGEADTPVLVAKHGDSSGVRGAAWLWPLPGR
ncbi:MAG TPA: fructokinase [Candidatus Eisenbacteria bacterium]|nr:fructokinase [Candidatus Eisenbacteria bacterium]